MADLAERWVEAAPARPEARIRMPLLQAGVMSNRRILIVDDNRDGAEGVCAMLKILGATVAVAYTGRTALDGLDRFGPDTMLVDLGLPDMDGCELARQIRASPVHQRMLLIALTGWGEDQDYRRTREAGFDHHLLKPADIHTLRGLLTRS